MRIEHNRLRRVLGAGRRSETAVERHEAGGIHQIRRKRSACEGGQFLATFSA